MASAAHAAILDRVMQLNKATPSHQCAGCGHLIRERFLLQVTTIGQPLSIFRLYSSSLKYCYCSNGIRRWNRTGTRIASSADAAGVASVKWDPPCTRGLIWSFANAITSDCLALRAVAPPVPKSSRPLRWWWGLKQTFTTWNASPVSSATRGTTTFVRAIGRSVDRSVV